MVHLHLGAPELAASVGIMTWAGPTFTNVMHSFGYRYLLESLIFFQEVRSACHKSNDKYPNPYHL